MCLRDGKRGKRRRRRRTWQFHAMRQKGGGLDDYPALRRSRRREWTKLRDFSLEPRNFGVPVVERITLL
jgi:hypothetical protein